MTDDNDLSDAHVLSNTVSEWRGPSLYQYLKRRRNSREDTDE